MITPVRLKGEKGKNIKKGQVRGGVVSKVVRLRRSGKTDRVRGV